MGAIKLGILISGGGSTFRNLQEKIEAGSLNAKICCVISSNPKANGLDLARSKGIPCQTVALKQDHQQFSAEINHMLQDAGVELVVLAGFLKLFLPDPSFQQRCINIHPSLIPAFCGPGFYGSKVHHAVYQRGCRVSGCTVHLVTAEYDAGPILHQVPVHLEDGDDPEMIQAKVFAAECEALPTVISWFQQGRVRFEKGRAIVAPI